MNKTKLRAYAPQARRDFLQMIRQRAELLGLTKSEVAPAREEGEYAIIEGRAYPKRYLELHKRINEKIKAEGIEPFIERIAYSWFNRFAALRFMEVNDLLAHGFRVLSARETGRNEPEILTHAAEIDLPGLDRNKTIELKLAGDKDAELYRLLLIAQCNELHRAMPFLFERVNDETEILLPDNLLHSDSVIRKMVASLDEADWSAVEIIGWLYQFYISEKKEEVIGKTVKSEDIPAATQLFTPNWIVKYMTQNSLGRLWLESNRHSQLAKEMEFYIHPSEEQRVQNPDSTLKPEEIKVLDPACGSGHILVEAYELLKAIYLERGYSSRDIPLLILENNLYGLDIDERAAQMASFALLMKARRDDRRIFEKINDLNDGQVRNPKSKIPNVIAVPDSSHLKADEIAAMFLSSESNASEQNVVDLLSLFEQGKTLGSLIRVPNGFGAVVDKLESAVEAKLKGGNSFEKVAARELERFVRAAKMLSEKYDCVVANPPYMGGKGMNGLLKTFAAKNFPDSKSDLFAMFIERGFELSNKNGLNAMVTMESWMFISSYEKFRENLLDDHTILCLLHLPYDGRGPTAMGINFGLSVFVCLNKQLENYSGNFSCARYFELTNEGLPLEFPVRNERLTTASAHDFKKIAGRPIAYWVSDKVRDVFEKGTPLGEVAETRKGMVTADNDSHVRFWFEVSVNKSGFNYPDREAAKASGKKWFPYTKGGGFRKWFGNLDSVVNWQHDGHDLRTIMHPTENRVLATNFNLDYIFKPNVNWGAITSAEFSARISHGGALFDAGGSACFPQNNQTNKVLGFLNTFLAGNLLRSLNPTLNFQAGNISNLPLLNVDNQKLSKIVEEAVSIARADWDSFETSWDFKRSPLVDSALRNQSSSVEECWKNWKNLCDERLARMQYLETENNRLFIEAYGLQDELSPEVPLEQITLARADAEKDARRLLSYFIGCLTGRYSLDDEGLVYADAGGKGFDAARYLAFAADDDGIVPVTDIEWFAQDAARQFERFVKTIWGEASLAQNMRWIAEQLNERAGETSIETIRRYFSSAFFKDHLQTYKKRPVYWLFSSGKQKAFEALVYLHRYNESTLPRMRHEYVLPLMSKLTAQIEMKSELMEEAQTTTEKNKAGKELEILRKKQTELAQFDEQLRHLADAKIALDLDDGVKANYGRFGEILAEVKHVAAAKE